MKVLFLDCDGVLNHTPDFRVVAEEGFIYRLNCDLIDNLKHVIEETSCKIVLSSAWRLMEGGRETVEKWATEIFDVTPNTDGCRGEQIACWLADHNEVERYAIVDDDSDMLPHQLPHFVQTDFDHGLTSNLAHRLICKLNSAASESKGRAE